MKNISNNKKHNILYSSSEINYSCPYCFTASSKSTLRTIKDIQYKENSNGYSYKEWKEIHKCVSCNKRYFIINGE